MSKRKNRSARLDSLRNSPTYVRAYEDLDFIHQEELRPVRLQMELLKPELLLNEHKINSTVVVFGSARIPSREEADKILEEAEQDLEKYPDDEVIKRRVRVAKRFIESSKYHEEARKFGELVSKMCQRDGICDFVVVTGGGPGIMEAANRGAYEADAKSIGLNITLPHEQEPNSYVTPELCFLFHYFAIRKMHFLLRSKALVVFPGGYGTLDELFETLTLIQNEKMEPVPVILFGQEFWNRAINLDYLVEEGVISFEDPQLIQYVETAEEAWKIILEYYGSVDAMKNGNKDF